MTATETTDPSLDRALGAGAPEPATCAECRLTGRPLTASGYCPVCAASGCARGDGDKVALPTPGDVAAAVQALRQHLAEVRGVGDQQHPGCLICDLASPQCPECGQRTDDMTSEDLDLHIVVEAGLGVTDAVALGCEGYIVAAVRAAALIAAAAPPPIAATTQTGARVGLSDVHGPEQMALPVGSRVRLCSTGHHGTVVGGTLGVRSEHDPGDRTVLVDGESEAVVWDARFLDPLDPSEDRPADVVDAARENAERAALLVAAVEQRVRSLTAAFYVDDIPAADERAESYRLAHAVAAHALSGAPAVVTAARRASVDPRDAPALDTVSAVIARERMALAAAAAAVAPLAKLLANQSWRTAAINPGAAQDPANAGTGELRDHTPREPIDPTTRGLGT